MVERVHGGTRGWTGVAAFSIIVPPALVAAYMMLSRVAIPRFKGWGDLAAVFACVLIGAIPIFRLRCGLLPKVVVSLLYISVGFMLLVGLAFAIDCSLFHDCD
jgi:uncharacterized membrane protein YGL010W